MNSKGHVLVTGGAGYIGSHTVVELVDAGYVPVIVDDFRNANRIVLKGLEKILGELPEFVEADICSHEELNIVFERFAFVGIIHFAAYKAVGESVREPLKYYKNNLSGLINVLELAASYNVRPFVFSSSCTVYGEPSGKIEVDEDTPVVKANSPYGNTKIIGEQIISDLFRADPLFRMMSLRYFNPIGAHPSGWIGEFPIGRPNNLLPFVTQTAIGKQEILTVFGNDYPTPDGTCIRDYIHVCDLASAHVKALDRLIQLSSGCNEFVNIGTGKGTSVLELINTFEKGSGESLKWQFGPRRSGDVVAIYANADRSKTILDWEPVFTVEDAVRDAWNWEQNLATHA